jgi:integrase
MSEEQKTKKPRRTRGTGGVFKPKGSRFWWIKYLSGGKMRYESSGSERKTDAQNLVADRVGDVRNGIAVTPEMGKITLDKGLAAVVTHYRLKERRSIGHVETRIKKHLLAWDGWRPDTRMVSITMALIQRYAEHRLEQGAKPASVNRELAIIRLAFSLAVRGRQLATKPHVEMLAENNVRTDFFETAEFKEVCEHLPEDLRRPMTFAYYTGWRVKSEVMPLEWPQVDRDAKVIRLNVGTTKNNAGRVLPYGQLPEMIELIDEAWKTHEALRSAGTLSPFVFPKADGDGWGDRFYGAWGKATEAAGYPGKIPHDFRRTTARNLVRRGVPESVAMRVTGHKTRSVFERYNIVTDRDVAEGLAKLTAQPVEEPKRQRGKVRQFRKRTGTEG